MFSKTVIAAVAATLFTTTNAHLFISTPAPIPGSNSKSPLETSGSNFPCQGADLSQGPVTNMAVGSQQPLKFDLGGGANTAVHGGGSCQVALTYETDKAKQKDPANWKVIHSWVGGCPTNAPGNLNTATACTSGDGGTNCVVNDFTFTIPPEAKSGNAILGWTWFNNIGNREMYMNCARVAITGGSGSLDGLPSLFTANIGIGGCTTTEQTNVDFPNPGKYVTKDAKLNYPLKAPNGCAAGTGSANVPSTPSGGSGSGSGSGSGTSTSSGSGSGSGTSTGSGSSSGSTGTATGSAPSSASSSTKGGKGGKGGSQGGAFAEGSPSAPSAAPSSAASTGSTPKPATAPASAPASGSSSGTGSCTNGAVACSASGFYCIDNTHFGECAFGCAVPMAMAAGTKCANNAVAHAVVQKRRSNLFQRL